MSNTIIYMHLNLNSNKKAMYLSTLYNSDEYESMITISTQNKYDHHKKKIRSLQKKNMTKSNSPM